MGLFFLDDPCQDHPNAPPTALTAEIENEGTDSRTVVSPTKKRRHTDADLPAAKRSANRKGREKTTDLAGTSSTATQSTNFAALLQQISRAHDDVDRQCMELTAKVQFLEQEQELLFLEKEQIQRDRQTEAEQAQQREQEKTEEINLWTTRCTNLEEENGKLSSERDELAQQVEHWTTWADACPRELMVSAMEERRRQVEPVGETNIQ
ncbi:hypothetical protein BKA93DRAFT_763599 [Sparassis latifolia]